MNAFSTNGIITLLTDFGESDAYIGCMHGVILSINRNATIVNVCHNVPKHNIAAGSFILANYYRYYPQGTIHVAIIDPGVGSARKPIVAVTDKYFFVAPDNGVLSYIFNDHPTCKLFEISNKKFTLSAVSNTFHGRDVFAPVAAHLSAGLDITSMGPALNHPATHDIHDVIETEKAIKGQIIYCDHFGNLVTNIRYEHIQKRPFKITLSNYTIFGIVNSYNQGEPNQPIAIIGSSNYLEIAVNQGNAANLLKMNSNDDILLEFLDIN